MPIIASHHSWKDKDHAPRSDWPDDCYVQWGGRGVVLGKSPYSTAFFEAFPAEGGFIRGEGETIALAEDSAFEKFTKESACFHRWSRKGYKNGGTICRNCGAFKSTMPAIVNLGSWREPLSSIEVMSAVDGGLEPAFPSDHPERARDERYRRRLFLRFRLHGFALPEPPAEPCETLGFGLTPYGKRCRDDFLAQVHERGGVEAIMAEEQPGFLDALSASMVRGEYESWLREEADSLDMEVRP